MASSRLYHSDNPTEQRLGGELSDLIDSQVINQGIYNGNPAAAELPQINLEMGNLFAIKKATQNGARELTPKNYLASMRMKDSTSEAKEFAMAAASVLGRDYPNSGTFGRFLANSVPLAAAGAVGSILSGKSPLEDAGWATGTGAIPLIANAVLANKHAARYIGAMARNPVAGYLRKASQQVGGSTLRNFINPNNSGLPPLLDPQFQPDADTWNQ
jgi:hypothetical protein